MPLAVKFAELTAIAAVNGMDASVAFRRAAKCIYIAHDCKLFGSKHILLFAIERELDTTAELADRHIVVDVALGTTDELIEQILPDKGDCAGHTDQDVNLLPGGSKTVYLDEVIAVDVGGRISRSCRCHDFQVLRG